MENEELSNYCRKLEKRIEQLEFRQTLMLSDSNVNRLLLDYNITQVQYTSIMDVMDQCRKELGNNKEINHGKFENDILKIVNRHDVDYHFCEYIAKAFMDDDRWEEVFPALYGDMPKYAYLKEDK